MIPRMKEKYKKEVVSSLKKEFNYKSVMNVPRLLKVVLNMGVGEGHENSKTLDAAVDELTAIAGQKAVKTTARKSIAGFKIREGYKIGCRVTLRGDVMWEFVDRLFNIALPRVRDFKGISPKAFDGRGNYNMGIKEQIIFTEIDYDKVEQVRGMNITFVTTADSDQEGLALLKSLGAPFKKQK